MRSPPAPASSSRHSPVSSRPVPHPRRRRKRRRGSPVTLSESGCEPSSLEVPAGPVVFEITNLGGDVGEFEILRGDFVIDEVENIVPGFQSNLVSRLDSGDYQLVCYTPPGAPGHARR